MGNTENNFQPELSRSYSLELPMEFKQNQFTLSTLDNVTPRVRHSLNQHENKRRFYAHKSNRLSLNHTTINDSQVELRNRQVGTKMFLIIQKQGVFIEEKR
jgi:hypothetical protein